MLKIPVLPSVAKTLAARLLGMEVVPLPVLKSGAYAIATEGERLLPLRYAYRASPAGGIIYEFPKGGQNLDYRLYTMAFNGNLPVPGKLCLVASVDSVGRRSVLEVNLLEPDLRLDGQALPLISRERQTSRKFVAEIGLNSRGRRFRRVCCHYLPFDNKPIGRDYYYGDDYVDYTRETDVDNALSLVLDHCSKGRLLDIGCALGIYTKSFLDVGFDAHGVDICEFAVAEARKLVSPQRVQQANLDTAEIPFRGAFDVFWMWDILEHSNNPRALLEKVTRQAAPRALLFLHTSNADSLMRHLQGNDWEGYSDYSHHGVDQITASSLAEWLRELGWEIVDWQCGHIWSDRVDPVMIRLRDAFQRIPELSVLLNERNLGDMLTVVARAGREAETSDSHLAKTS